MSGKSQEQHLSKHVQDSSIGGASADNNVQGISRKLPKRIAEARRLGVPDATPWANINHLRMEEVRRERSTGLGLQADSTWGEIFEFEDELERLKVTAELSLSATATWRNIVTSLLGLPNNATGEEVVTQIRKLHT